MPVPPARSPDVPPSLISKDHPDETRSDAGPARAERPTPGRRRAQRHTGPAPKVGLAALLRSPGMPRLLVTRFCAQWGDGLFQAALGGAVLFNPERQADPMAVAAGLAVLLLPYSLVGPFAGALLDRWDRRRVLIGANLLRALLIAIVAAAVGAGVAGPALYLGALAVVGVSRFLLAGLSAALPHVVTGDERGPLVEANVVATTAGAAFAALGGATAIGVRALVGAGNAGSAVTTSVAILGSLGAAVAAAGFARGTLGPGHGSDAQDVSKGVPGRHPGGAARTIARGLTGGATAVLRTPAAAAAFLAVGAHRLAFGVLTLLSLLLFRYRFTAAGPLRTGLVGVGQAVVLIAAGIGVAAVVTPWLTHRLGRTRTVGLSLVVATAGLLVLAGVLTLPTLLVAAFVVSAAGQVVKLCADAVIQSEIDDEVRGRVFALYDALFNVCYVLAVTAAALLSPPDGDAPLLVAGAAAVHLLGLAGFGALLRRRSDGTLRVEQG